MVSLGYQSVTKVLDIGSAKITSTAKVTYPVKEGVISDGSSLGSYERAYVGCNGVGIESIKMEELFNQVRCTIDEED